MKICILCGGVGHDQSECPWVEAQQERSVAPLFAISAVVALTCVAVDRGWGRVGAFAIMAGAGVPGNMRLIAR